MPDENSNDKSVLEGSKAELERLRITHEMYKRALVGELLQPDVKLYLEQQSSQGEDVKILDSGTADGEPARATSQTVRYPKSL